MFSSSSSRIVINSACISRSLRLGSFSRPFALSMHKSASSRVPLLETNFSSQNFRMKMTNHTVTTPSPSVADKEEELLELCTSDGTPTGVAKARGLVHQHGDHHKVVHIWVINKNNGQILLQKRSKNKKAYPSKYDISSAGHIPFGETSIEGAQHELAEELGIVINNEELYRIEKLYTYFQHFTLHNGTFIENEWPDVYLVSLDKLDISELTLQPEEVDGVALVHYKQLEQLMKSGDDRLVPVANHGRDALKFFDILDARYSSTNVPENYVDLETLN